MMKVLGLVLAVTIAVGVNAVFAGAGCCPAGKTKVQASNACDVAGKLSLTDGQKAKVTALKEQANRAPSTSEANAIMTAGLEKILTAEQLAECKASCEKDKGAGKCPIGAKTDKKS